MAIIKGVPGALSNFIKTAREYGFEVSSIEDLINLKNQKIEEIKILKPMVIADIKQEIEELERKYNSLEENIDKKTIQIQSEIEFEIAKLISEIQENTSIPLTLLNILKLITSFFSNLKKRTRLQSLSKWPNKEIQRRLKKDLSDFDKVKSQLYYLKNNFEIEVDAKLSHIKKVIDRLVHLIESPEYKGALGEIKMHKTLSYLPNTYYVFHDVKIKMDKWLRYDGKPLYSAQLDHLVVGPTGVYVIETKNWSKEFISKNFQKDEYGPYEQIKRGSYVLYRHLNRLKYGNVFQQFKYFIDNNNINVKSIIAIVDSKIPTNANTKARILFLNKVNNYILGNKEILSKEIIEIIAKNLEHFICFHNHINDNLNDNDLIDDNLNDNDLIDDDLKRQLDALNKLIKT